MLGVCMVFWAPCVTDNEDYSLIIILIVPAGRDCMRISKLALLQLILSGKISCILGSLDIPLQSLAAGLFTVFTTLSFTFQDDAELGLVSDDNTPCQGNLEEKCS